jgi:hypothetical protein
LFHTLTILCYFALKKIFFTGLLKKFFYLKSFLTGLGFLFFLSIFYDNILIIMEKTKKNINVDLSGINKIRFFENKATGELYTPDLSKDEFASLEKEWR